MPLNTELSTAPNTQPNSDKPSPRSIQRKFRSLLLLAVSGGALIATPQLARAEFTPNPAAPNYVATGAETTPQVVTDNNANVTTDDTFSVTTSEGNALTITGNGAIVYSDANSSDLVATGNYGALVVHSTGDDGIFGEDGYTRGKVTITTNGDLTGGSVGMDVTNSGSDRTNITSTGTVTATDSSGIGVKVAHGPSAYDMTVKVADVTGGQTGISIQKQGIGSTDLIATGTVIGTSGTGVFVTDNSAASGTRVTVVGVTGGTDGVRLEGYSIGDATITATGTVTGTTGTGIAVNYNNTSGNDVTVKAAAVTGGQTGISALNKGRGDTSVTATGTVAATGDSSTGIVVTNEENTVDLTVNAASVSGGEFGIKATNNGTGNTSVTATGTVTASVGTGIDVLHNADGNLTVNAADVTGGINGIIVSNLGAGETSITSTGTVTGTSGYGISVETNEDAQKLTVNANNVTGGLNGILANHKGSGETSVTATGTVIATTIGSGTDEGVGILVENTDKGSDITVNAHNVTGERSGIKATNNGDGNTSITSTGTVTGTQSGGISAIHGTDAQSITINAVNVSSEDLGIYTSNQGQGSTSITSTGTVVGSGGSGIKALNGENTQNLTVTAVNVSGGEYGITASNDGSGDTTIISTGTVAGTGAGGVGIRATNEANANDLTLEVNNVSGAPAGIKAVNEGKGDTSITSTGTITATEADYPDQEDDGVGLYVTNGSETGNLTVEVNNVNGAKTGILAQNSGTGNTSITATGTVEATNINGIFVTNGADTGNLTVNAAAVSGGSYGINVNNNGGGDTSITATGTVTGTGISSTGIYAMNSATTNDLTIETAAVSSNNYGITALNYGSGDTSITATGDITASGFTGEGITVVDSSTSTEVNEITVDVVNVSGSSYGISVNNNGYGSATITATGTVEGTGTYSTGIYVASTYNTQDLAVNAAAVSGGDYGINTRNSGSGDTTITATGTVTGTRTGGIYAENNSNANDIKIEAAAVSGSVNGISATNYGKGDTSVKATGDVTSTANSSNGIYAVNYNTAQDLTVEATNVTSSYNGISATNYGSGDTKITVTGDVEGTDGNGIIVSNSGSESQDLTVEAVNVTGNEYGISATNNGTGNTSVTATGDVIATGTNGTGISVTDSSTSTEVNELTVDVVNVTGGSYGISVNNNGYGSATITATGTVEATGTYSTGIYVASTFNTQDLTVNAAAVSGGDYGIYTRNNGKGDTSITATGTVTGTRSSGIYAENSTYANDITIEAAAVSGSDNGIYASNFGIGNTSVKATGDVTSTANSSNGIYAVNYNTAKDLTVEATNVTSAYHGINATNYGSGDTKITATGDVTGTGGTGIIVYNDVIAQDLTVEAAAVTGNEYGIYTENYGTGITSITATGLVEATGEGSTGINAYNGGETSDLTVEAAAVTGGDVGINANNEGDGDTSVTATGTVEGTSNIGIQVGNGENANDLTVEAAAVTGGNSGIVANNYGNGNSSVTATGLVEGGTDAGIRVINGENAVDLTVEAAAVTGAIYGINTENNGTGDTSITATGTVTGTDFVGIEILNGENTGDLTVEAAAVTGGNTGISVNNNGSGNTSVTATGLVTGTNETGVYANNNAGAVNLTVEVAGVDGNNFGVNANNDGSGSTRVAATGTVNATGAEGIGIQANNGGEATGLTVEAADVTGTNAGIAATNNGTGDTSITATGTVEGTDNDGISVTNSENTNDLTVEAVAVTGGNIGIVANNNGSGNTGVTATGTVTGTGHMGINVNNGENTQNLTVEAATVNGAEDGINVLNNGTGDTSITVTGKATGTNYAGIYAVNSENAQSLTVEAVAATGGLYGIYAENNGSGNTSVTSTGMALGTGEGSTGINVFSGGNTHNLTIEAASATGVDVGINANNEGDGDTLIKATGLVEGTDNVGIQVGNNENANDLTVEAAAVTGGHSGIVANNNGRGDTSVTATGTVTGENGDGFRAYNGSLAQNLTVSAVNVTGSEHGISAQNDGNGDTSVTSTGTVEGEAGHGIFVTSSVTANNLSVNAVNVIGASQGINTNNDGSGNTSITSTGTVTGKGSHGIMAWNQSAAGNLSIEAVNVTGAGKGISANNFGTGDTSVTATGTVSGQNEEGVYVDNGEGTNDLTVNVVNVTGKSIGIYANNLGSGNTSITTTGTVTGTDTDGIVALNGENAVDLAVNTAAVTASKIGITVNNLGSGDTSVTATGTVTGTEETGIYAITGANTQDLIINAVSATGFYEGVYARNTGNGDTSVTVTGTATATRASGVGIKAINDANNQNLTVNVANATGGATGVNTYNGGTGTTAINVSGIVEGGDEGISVSSSEDQAIIITINGTVRNSSQSSADTAIVNGSGIVIINNNQSLLGTVSLGASGNTINNKGTWSAGGGTSDLGSGANILNNQAGGSILAVGSDGPVSTTFNGVDTLTQSGSIVLQNQRAGGTTAYTGDVATFTNGGSGDFQANGGVVYLDTDFEAQTSDVLVVDNVSRQGNATALFINPATAGGQALAGDGIEVVDVQGTSTNDAFVLAEPVNAGLFSYGLGQGTQDSQSWFLQSSLRPEASAAGALSVLGSRTALSTLPGMNDRLREDYDEEERYGSRSGARLVSRDLTLPDAKPQASKGVWGRVLGESSEFKSKNGVGYDAKLWGAQAGLDFYATSNQQGDRQVAGVYLGHASASGDALGGSGVIGSLNVDATTVGAYYTYSAARGWYVDATAQYSKLSDMKLAAGGETVRPDGSSYAVSLEAGKVLNQQSKLRTELQAQVIYQKTDIDDITLSDNTRLTLGGLNTTTGRVGVRLSKNPQYAGKFQPWLRANLWHTLNEEATVSSMGTTMGTAIGGTSGEVQVGFALTSSQSSSWSAYAAAGYTFDLSGAQYSGWKGSLGLRKGW